MTDSQIGVLFFAFIFALCVDHYLSRCAKALERIAKVAEESTCEEVREVKDNVV